MRIGFGHGEVGLIHEHMMDIYFESSGTILTLITLGKYLETKSKSKTGDAISKLINLAPKTSTVIRNNEEVSIPSAEIAVGDVLVIKPGESIPIDGMILEGATSIDESSITGESMPISKCQGDMVISGTVNLNGAIKVEAKKVGEDTTLSQIIKLVEEAGNSKAPISKLADKVSGVFVPIVIGISVITFITWIFLGAEINFALSLAVAVLVISCPCALGLATPVAIMVGTGKGAENGILIKSAESLEALHSVNTVVLDKTGTITEGKPEVTDIMSADDVNTFLKLAATLEKNSEHPLAKAIVKRAKEDKVELGDVISFEAVSGRGVKGIVDGVLYYAGNASFMVENGIDVSKAMIEANGLAEEGKTVLYFSNNQEIIGMIAISDVIKSTSYEAIKELQKKRLQVVMLTGDNQTVASHIGKQLEIEKIVAEVMPADKEKEVARLQEEGRKVAFIGDGINDSPALTKADVGIAIGSGTDIAIESADIVLMKNNIQDAVSAIELSKATMNNIKMNLFWAFFYNIIGIPLAAGVLYHSLGLKLNPMIGALAMSFSSVCVVTNALRLRFFKSSFAQNAPSPLGTEKEKINEEEEKMVFEKKIMIEGMQCNHCKMTVEKTLSAIEGVTSVEVSLEKKNAVIKSNVEIDDDTITKTIEEAGFTVKEIM